MTGAPGAPVTGVARQLVGQGLLDAADVLDHGVRVSDRSRSHTLTLVRVGAGRGGVVLKRPSAGGERGLGQEAAIYAHAARHAELRTVIPAVRASAHGRLVLELVDPARTLLERHHETGTCEPPASHALGIALGTVHRGLAHAPPPITRVTVPWILGALEPGRPGFEWQRPGGGLHGLADPAGLRGALAGLRATYRPRHVIHGDLKWDNALVVEEAAGPVVRIVDWELATVGDPAWDIAGALQEYVAHAITSGTPVEACHAAASAFWDGYVHSSRLDPAARAGLGRRAARLAGARLLQTACEAAVAHGAGPLVPLLQQRARELLTTPADELVAILSGSAR